MMVKSFGCSFIFGNELHDDNRGHLFPSASQHTWPALLAQRAGTDYACYARGGSGNLAIFDQIMQHLGAGGDDFYIIGWTWSSRYDHNRETARNTHAWHTLAPPMQDPSAEFYYRELHSEYRDVVTTLTYILTVINLLRQQSMRFLMTNIDPIVFDDKWQALPGVCLLQTQVHPHITDFQGKDFLSWSRDHGFEITAAQHPLEAAHAAAADLLSANFDTIRHRA